jgi:ornithine cyclodeaminase/alanine dehydrogenase-like protein (mu-crystallin family)
VTLAVVELSQISAVATKPVVFAAVRSALIAHAEGRTQVPPPIHLEFPDADGDCHVKAGQILGAPHFTVKVAAGFYRNAQHGLPNNNGLVLVLNAKTGVPAALLADQGWLTAWRTAAAGALITDALTPPEVDEIGVLDTGLQARLQVEWLHALRPLRSVWVWGRRLDATRQLCNELIACGLNARPATIEQAASSACVVTATPSLTPLAVASAYDGAVHVTGIGTDLPGKEELPPGLFGGARLIATDDHAQCLDHGDFGNAVRAGTVAPEADTVVGAVLRDGIEDAVRGGRSPTSLASGQPMPPSPSRCTTRCSNSTAMVGLGLLGATRLGLPVIGAAARTARYPGWVLAQYAPKRGAAATTRVNDSLRSAAGFRARCGIVIRSSSTCAGGRFALCPRGRRRVRRPHPG